MNPTELVATYQQRRRDRQQIIGRMHQIRDIYNGDLDVATPELDRQERSAVANLFSMGLDQSAERITATLPDITFFARRPGIERSEEQARQRRRAMLAWWEQNSMKRKLRRAARWLLGYSIAPILVDADHARMIPLWRLRDPLGCYPAPNLEEDDFTPPDVIFAYRRGLSWLRAHYPEQAARLSGAVRPVDLRYDLLEYHDAEQSMLVVTAERTNAVERAEEPQAIIALLEQVPNRIGVCPVVLPNRITLDRIQGQFDGMVGMYQTQSKLMSLAVLAAQRDVFPEEWAVAQPGQNLQVVPPDPVAGRMGEIRGGTVQHVPTAISPTSVQMIDRLERNMRVTAGVPAELGGESTSNIRTGRRGDSVLSAVIDFPLQEHQEILAEGLRLANSRAIKIARAYWGRRQFSFWPGYATKPVDFVPDDVFEDDRHTVTFSYTGMDANNAVIAAGQRMGLGAMSRRTFMEHDPQIDDYEIEHERVIGESLEQAQLQSLQTLASQGQIQAADLARITELVQGRKLSLYEAISQAHRETQARQQAEQQAQPPGPGGAPPGGAPGLGAGPAGATVAPPGPGMGNLEMLLNQLKRTGTQPGPAAQPVT